MSEKPVMQTPIVYWGHIRDNGKQNGNYHSTLIRVIWG